MANIRQVVGRRLPAGRKIGRPHCGPRLVSQPLFRSVSRLGCTRFGSPGIFGVPCS